jgi:integrase
MQTGDKRWSILDETLRSHFEILYRPKKLFGKSAETSRLYHFTFDYFRRFLGREPAIGDLQDHLVMGCMEWIVGQGLSIRTANKTRDQLLALWRFLARKSVVPQWPDVPSFPEPQRSPVAWNRDELRSLWEMCENQRGKVAGVPANLWWIGIHSVAWDSLERIGAVRFLRKDHVFDDCKWVHFPAEIRKGRRQDFTSKLHPTTGAIIRQILAVGADSPFVFPWERRPEYLHTRYKALRERAGLATDRFHSFHCLRRTGASFAEAAGADASKLLGHASRRTTDKHYIDVRVSGKQMACDVLFRPLDDGPDKPAA